MGERFDKYELVEELARGGMGKVYRARIVGAAGFEKIVALKLMLPKRAGDADAIRNFQDEARLAASLTHANIVGILDFGVRGGNWYLAMEYVYGANLRALLELARSVSRPPTPVLAAFIAAEAARGLDYAHKKTDEAGRELAIVHRDISPQNIVASWSGEVKILDFGIALARNRAQDANDGVVRGKFAYMSPEQALGEEIDRRSDIFSLGSVLYELLTGDKAFPQPGMRAAIAVSSCEYLPPDRVRPDLPTRLVSIVMQAMAKDPADRYQTADAMVSDLTQWLAEQRMRGGKQEDEAAALSRWSEEVLRAAMRNAPPVPGPAGAENSDARTRDMTFSDFQFAEPNDESSGEGEWVPPRRSVVVPADSPSRVSRPGLAATDRVSRGDTGAKERASKGGAASAPAAAENAAPSLAPWNRPRNVGAYAAIAAALSIAAIWAGVHHSPPGSGAVTPAPSIGTNPTIATPNAVATSSGVVAAIATTATAAAPIPSPAPSAAVAVRHIGLLQVSSTIPGAKVFLDGKEISDAPVLIPNLAVPAHYAVEVRKEGFAFWGREVDLADDDRVEVVATLSRPGGLPGNATFEIPAGLSVVLDGKIVGTSGTVTVSGEPGLHQVHLHDRSGKLVKDFNLELRSNETTIPALP